MERLLNALTAMAGNIPALAWIGYVHLSRPSRKECEERHNAAKAHQESLCHKIDALHEAINRNNDLINQHLLKG